MNSQGNKTLRVIAWISCIASAWMILGGLQMFTYHSGWGELGYFILSRGLIFSVAVLVCLPLGILYWCKKRPYDLRSLMISAAGIVTLGAELVCVMYFGGGSSGC